MAANEVVSDLSWFLRGMMPLTRYPYEGEAGGCPVCGDTSHAPVSTLDRRLKRLSTVACEGCGLLYTNPMPTEDELSRYYSRLYRFDYQLSVRRPGGRHVTKRTREARTRIEAVADLLPPGATTIDFGAGSGEFVASMLDLGYDAYGFEPGGNYGSHARERCGERISIARWQDISHRDRFDLVTSFHVFEHLRDPVNAFRSAAAWVKPGGLVHVEVPDAVEQLRVKGFGSLHFAHVIGFNRHNLALAAAMAGLEVERSVAPTSIIFRRTDATASARRLGLLGAALTFDVLRARPLAHSYLRHHAGKIGLARQV